MMTRLQPERYSHTSSAHSRLAPNLPHTVRPSTSCDVARTDELIQALGPEGNPQSRLGRPSPPQPPGCSDRFEGFNNAVDAAGGVEVVSAQVADYDRARGLDVMSNILQAEPDIVGVFAENDEMALGAIQALGERAGTDVFVVGIDGTPDALTAIEDGSMFATVAQQAAELGKAGVNQALASLAGDDLPETTVVDVQIVRADG